MNRQTLSTSTLIELLGIIDPFLMIDSVFWSSHERTAVGVKVISENDWFYKCHFINDPVMPGVLQTEVMLQTLTATICAKLKINAKDCLINKSSVNFFKKITGNGTLTATVEVGAEYHGIITGKAVIDFNGQKACTGAFRFLRPQQLGI